MSLKRGFTCPSIFPCRILIFEYIEKFPATKFPYARKRSFILRMSVFSMLNVKSKSGPFWLLRDPKVKPFHFSNLFLSDFNKPLSCVRSESSFINSARLGLLDPSLQSPEQVHSCIQLVPRRIQLSDIVRFSSRSIIAAKQPNLTGLSN